MSLTFRIGNCLYGDRHTLSLTKDFNFSFARAAYGECVRKIAGQLSVQFCFGQIAESIHLITFRGILTEIGHQNQDSLSVMFPHNPCQFDTVFISQINIQKKNIELRQHPGAHGSYIRQELHIHRLGRIGWQGLYLFRHVLRKSGIIIADQNVYHTSPYGGILLGSKTSLCFQNSKSSSNCQGCGDSFLIV